MKKSLDFSIRYGKADGWMLKLCLLCLICLGGVIYPYKQRLKAMKQ